MSDLGQIQERFLQHISELGVEKAAEEFKTFPSTIKRWMAGSHSPPIDKIIQFYDSQKPVVSPRQEAEWEGRDVMILVPALKQTNPATMWALLATALDLGREKVRFDMEQGNSMIYNSRNKLAKSFLESDCEWSLWIDDDMIPPVGRPDWFKKIGSLPEDYPRKAAEMHWVHRLMSHKKSIVGGTYYGRFSQGPPLFGQENWRNNGESHAAARRFQDAIQPIDWVATGCLLVHRSVYEAIQATHPFLAPGKKDFPTVDEESGEMKMVPIEFNEWQFFWPRIGCGEDVSFCRRAKEAGHQVFIDTGLQALHVGYSCYHALNTRNTVDQGFKLFE